MNSTCAKNDRELQLEGFTTSQNVQSTKHSIKDKHLKYRKTDRSVISDASDPVVSIQNNILSKHSNFTRGDRNIPPKYKLLSKPMNSDHAKNIKK